MVGTADAVTRQCLVKYALLKKEWKDKLLGLEDERTRRVHRVLERLIAANHLEKGVLGGKWEVMVVDSLSEFYGSTRASRANKKSLESEQLVVSILPGSKVILNTSSITFYTHDSELAHLIAHQIAHVLLEHRRESLSHFSIYTPIMWILITLDWKMLVGQLFILGGLDFFVLGKAAQAREFEADRLGMILAAKAGYNPSAAVEVWGKLDRLKDRLLSDYSSFVSSPGV
jgi:Zn-dependent protease with chaperone function